MNAPQVDPALELRLRLHEAIARAACPDDAGYEDSLAALSSCLCALLSAAQDPQAAYIQFLQDFSIMWREGMMRFAQAKANGSVAQR